MKNTLEVRKVSKIYPGRVQTQALSDIDLTVQQGEFIGVMGSSGSGKTTLLNLIATIDVPTAGEILINQKNPHTLKRNQLAYFRRRELGFIFQDFNLLDTLTIAENIVLPLTLDKIRLSEMENRLQQVAEALDIVSLLNKRTYEVSGGQRQRAAIARATIHHYCLQMNLQVHWIQSRRKM
ncbi:ABC-type lipoprotein export system, ATPase component [Seinonella peptonophila]|uniref:ABC-type lipoprotein export system, ATPase component n=1 Tax=Seinonella peptonophila TaxID=112248 RepID=A0A1M4W6J2_9BACL|nr:ABC-type lipoprotein export system, ATPase component [Seinonella peptonophila]